MRNSLRYLGRECATELATRLKKVRGLDATTIRTCLGWVEAFLRNGQGTPEERSLEPFLEILARRLDRRRVQLARDALQLFLQLDSARLFWGGGRSYPEQIYPQIPEASIPMTQIQRWGSSTSRLYPREVVGSCDIPWALPPATPSGVAQKLAGCEVSVNEALRPPTQLFSGVRTAHGRGRRRSSAYLTPGEVKRALAPRPASYGAMTHGIRGGEVPPGDSTEDQEREPASAGR
jgi:hypothetical protein